MDKNEAVSIIQKYLTCIDIAYSCSGKCAKCRYYISDKEVELALKLVIEALGGETDERTNLERGCN